MSQPISSMAEPLTRITVDTGEGRAEDVGGALARRGFAVRREAGRLVAESDRVEAQDAKRYLRSLGFQDREYRVFLEDVRAWGAP